ncbi:hypothetical protein RUND412_010760, partial [Rhizina undulata]
DHLSNKLNAPAGEIAPAIVAYAVPRIVYAWENPAIPAEQVLNDIVNVFHHPTLRNPQVEIHNIMLDTVRKWINRLPDRGRSLNIILSQDGVHQGQNHEGGVFAGGCNGGGHGKMKGGEWDRRNHLARRMRFFLVSLPEVEVLVHPQNHEALESEIEHNYISAVSGIAAKME